MQKIFESSNSLSIIPREPVATAGAVVTLQMLGDGKVLLSGRELLPVGTGSRLSGRTVPHLKGSWLMN